MTENLADPPLLSTGSPAPLFALPDLAGKMYRLEETRGRMTLLNFWSAECPWSARVDEALGRLLAGWETSVTLLTIASNANESIDQIRLAAGERRLPVVLYDSNQVVAGLYGARTTPHLFLLDPQGILRYQGAFDDVTFRRQEPTRAYVQAAVEALLSGRRPDPAQTPPYGCTIVRYTP